MMYGTPGGMVEMLGGLVAYWYLAMIGGAIFNGYGVGEGKNWAGVAEAWGVGCSASAACSAVACSPWANSADLCRSQEPKPMREAEARKRTAVRR